MTYVYTRCPHCGFTRRQVNPPHLIGSPFTRCVSCGKYYEDSYCEEWIMKSPLKRHWFFVQNGTWARAIMLPAVILAPLFGAVFDLPELIFPLWLIFCITWFICGYLFYKKRFQKDIEASLERTKDPQYVELLKKVGYKIYPLE